MKPLVAITLSNHWSIKNLIHSGFAAKLQKHCRLQLWTQASRMESLGPTLQHFQIEAELRALPDYQESLRARWWRLVQKSALYERHNLSTERIASKSHRGRRGRLAKMFSPIGRWIARSPIGESVLKLASARRLRSIPTAIVSFGELPSIVLIGNPFDFREDPITCAAIAAGIEVATMIPSWDNLTSKGVIDSRYGLVFVWSQTMADELVRLYPAYDHGQVIPSGLPRMDAFDSCGSPDGAPERSASKLILYANTATKSFPQQPQVIHHLVSALESGCFGDCDLLIRCHPHDDPLEYARFGEHSRVSVWPRPEDMGSAFGVHGCPPVDDLTTLASMIQLADVVVNAASTIALDAAYCGKPIVSVAYDGDESPTYVDSILSAYDYEHQRPFLESNAGVLCRSREELISAVLHALSNPIDRAEQRRTLAKLISQGNAVDQMVSVCVGRVRAVSSQEGAA